jgi:hypothetical protein
MDTIVSAFVLLLPYNKTNADTIVSALFCFCCVDGI